jgi:hypothetical protein
MSSAIRWRILTLEVVLVVLLAAGSAFAFYEGHFVTNMVTEQLTAQKIYFPPASEIKSGGALDPAKFPPEIQAQAGNQVTNGDQARIYADDFIAVHLQSVAQGRTYAQVSSDAIALQAKITTTPKDDPSYASMQAQLAALNGQRAALFQGETLRSILLNSYGWWTLGVYATYAAIGLLVAAIVVLGALVFEVLVAIPRPERATAVEKSAG